MAPVSVKSAKFRQAKYKAGPPPSRSRQVCSTACWALPSANSGSRKTRSRFGSRPRPTPTDCPSCFFIPGGGFTTGSGESRWYKSQELVRQGRIVLVTVNYRIGVLGHFGPLGDPVESSKPIRDLQAALGWVGERFLPRWYRRTQPDLWCRQGRTVPPRCLDERSSNRRRRAGHPRRGSASRCGAKDASPVSSPLASSAGW